MTVVRTARLVGTPITHEDGPLLAGLLTDPRVAATLGGVPSEEQLDETVTRQAAHWSAHGFGCWMWRDARTGSVVARGGLGLVVVGRRADVEVSWAVDAEHWGEGLGSELGEAAVAQAFGPLDVDELAAFTLPGNFASRRIMAKLAFVRQDEHVVKAGLDHLVYRRRRPREAPTGELA